MAKYPNGKGRYSNDNDFDLHIGELVIEVAGSTQEMISKVAGILERSVPWNDRWLPGGSSCFDTGKIRLYLKRYERNGKGLRLTYDLQDHGHRSAAFTR